MLLKYRCVLLTTVQIYVVNYFIFAGQALCGQCRDETHRAKMFSKHDIIHMSMKTKENAKKVPFLLLIYLVDLHLYTTGCP